MGQISIPHIFLIADKIFGHEKSSDIVVTPQNLSTSTCLGKCLPDTKISKTRRGDLGSEMFF